MDSERDLTEEQNERLRRLMRTVVKPPKGTGTLSQAAVAEAIGVGQPAVSSFLGKRQGLSFRTALLLLKLTGGDPKEILDVDVELVPPRRFPNLEAAVRYHRSGRWPDAAIAAARDWPGSDDLEPEEWANRLDAIAEQLRPLMMRWSPQEHAAAGGTKRATR